MRRNSDRPACVATRKRSSVAQTTGITVAAEAVNAGRSARHAILADTVGITLRGQLNITPKFEAGLDEVKNSVA